MTVFYFLIAIAVVVGLAAAFWWQRTGPGKRICFGSATLYYSPPVTTDEVQRVIGYLKRENLSDQPMVARLLRHETTYQFQVILSGPPADNQVTVFEVLAAGLSDDVFAGAAVEVHVCDDIFRPYVVISHMGRYGRRITMNAAHLFYLDGVRDDEAFSVAAFLAGVGLFNDSPKIAQMNRSADGYEFRLAVNVDPRTPEMIDGMRRMSSDLSQVLGGASVAVCFCDGPLVGTLRAVEPRAAECGREHRHVPGGPYRTEVACVRGDLAERNELREKDNPG